MEIPVCLKSELDHFSTIPIQTAMEHAKYITYLPINNNLTSDTISFEVSGSPEEAIDLYHSELLLDVQILKTDNTYPLVDALYGPVNNFARSLFSGHELSLNEEVVSSVPNMSHMGAYIETLLNYGHSAQNGLLDVGWVLDKADTLDNVEVAVPQANPAYNLNTGMLKRREQLAAGTIWRMYTKVPSDLAHQTLLIPPKVGLKLTLTRAKDTFALLSSENPFQYKTRIEAASLRIRKVKLDSEFLLAHEAMIMRRNALIPYIESTVNEFGIANGSSTWNRQDVFRGLVPKKMILGLVDSSAVIGDLKKNPYNFVTGGI